MLIKRDTIKDIENVIQLLSDKKFDIKTQYKFIKINKVLKQEEEIYNEQIRLNCQDFFERDENGNPLVNEDGGYKIKKDRIQECYLMIDKMNNLEIQIPDIYFTLDELESLNLTLNELLILEKFIKN